MRKANRRRSARGSKSRVHSTLSLVDQICLEITTLIQSRRPKTLPVCKESEQLEQTPLYMQKSTIVCEAARGSPVSIGKMDTRFHAPAAFTYSLYEDSRYSSRIVSRLHKESILGGRSSDIKSVSLAVCVLTHEAISNHNTRASETEPAMGKDAADDETNLWGAPVCKCRFGALPKSQFLRCVAYVLCATDLLDVHLHPERLATALSRMSDERLDQKMTYENMLAHKTWVLESVSLVPQQRCGARGRCVPRREKRRGAPFERAKQVLSRVACHREADDLLAAAHWQTVFQELKTEGVVPAEQATTNVEGASGCVGVLDRHDPRVLPRR